MHKERLFTVYNSIKPVSNFACFEESLWVSKFDFSFRFRFETANELIKELFFISETEFHRKLSDSRVEFCNRCCLSEICPFISKFAFMIRLYKIRFQIGFDIIPSDRIRVRIAIMKAKPYCSFPRKYSIKIMINIGGSCIG